MLTASAHENPDLFWGLKGGGGNFGIVTSFTLRLHAIGPMIYGGMLVSLPDRAPDVLRFLRDYMADAPDDLGLGAVFVSAPPEPFVPEEMHFAPIFGIIVCWTGDAEEGARVLGPSREVAQPVMDMVGPMPYVALQSMLDGGGPHGTCAYMKAEFLPELSDQIIDKMSSHGGSRPGPMVQLLLEPMGGAISRVSPGAQGSLRPRQRVPAQSERSPQPTGDGARAGVGSAQPAVRRRLRPARWAQTSPLSFGRSP